MVFRARIVARERHGVTATQGSARVLVTGADGFVGRHLQQTLADRGVEYRAAIRAGASSQTNRRVPVGDIGPRTDWRTALDGIDVVVHLAGRAHVLRETAETPRAEFMRVNAEGTATLVAAAVAAGVRRIIYVSSIGVLGNATSDTPFTADSPPRPYNAYSESKLAGEIAARSVAGAQLDIVVVRPPLVYGPGVRANFLRLLHLIDKEWPLPLGAVKNKRSLVSIWNLCDLLMQLLTNPAAAQRNWLVSDGDDLSTPALIRRIAKAIGRRSRLVPVPVSLLNLVGGFTGRGAEIAQLCGSLAVDISQTRRELGWSPPVTVNDALARTAEWYLSDGRFRGA